MATEGAVIFMLKWPFNFLESNHISSPAVSVITREWTAKEERGIPPLFISPTLTRSLVITIGGSAAANEGREDIFRLGQMLTRTITRFCNNIFWV